MTRSPFAFLAALGLLMAAPLARAQTYSLTPETFRATLKAAQATGGLGVCTKGDFPAVRLPSVSYKFVKPFVLDCSAATSIGAWYWAYAENITFKGGRHVGRLSTPGGRNITVTGSTFEGTGYQASGGSNVTVVRNEFKRSGAAISTRDIETLLIDHNQISDFAGDAAIALYGGSDHTVTNNVISGGSRPIAKGVHPDAIQSANLIAGKTLIADNTIVGDFQGIFLGGVHEQLEISGNDVTIDYPNAIAWKSGTPAIIRNNTVRKLPGGDGPFTPRFHNYGSVPATDQGRNSVDGKALKAR